MSTIAVNTINPATGSSVAINSYVPPAQFAWRNRIMNGDMTIAQRGTSFPAASNVYTLDRWASSIVATPGVFTVSQQSDVPSNNEFQNSLRILVTTQDTSIAAGEYYAIQQPIEGYNVRDLIGDTFTLSFWVRSAKTGVHCVNLRNANTADRSYVAEYTVSVANVWEFKTITVSGGLITAGTWNWTNGLGLIVSWALAAGSTYQTTAGAWQTGNFIATSSQVNVLDAVNNIFAITGVQLEAGSVATPFEHRPYGAELALCQRYYEIGSARWRGVTVAGSVNYGISVPFKTNKRAINPVLAFSGFATAGANFSGIDAGSSADSNSADIFANASVGGGAFYYTNWTASAEF